MAEHIPEAPPEQANENEADTIGHDWRKAGMVGSSAVFAVAIMAVAGYELRKYAAKRHQENDS